MESVTKRRNHGKSRTKLYRVWKGIKERCYYEKHKSYAYYGGRGIRVCEEWFDFEAFEKWAMANGYQEGLKIDRYPDNNGPYAPWNCRITTHEENCNNMRNNVKVQALGEDKSLSRWERDGRTAVSKNTIRRRTQHGMSAEEALLLPPRRNYDGTPLDRFVLAFGENKKVSDWCIDARCKVSRSILHDRLNRDWAPEDAITTPPGLFTASQRSAEKVTAFGETKLFHEWAMDPRCVVKETTLRRRVTAYAWPAEAAITTPSARAAG